jgi:hypothetical protein
LDTDAPRDAVTASLNNPSRHNLSPSFSTGPEIFDFKVDECRLEALVLVLGSRSKDLDNDRAIGENIIRIDVEAFKNGDDRFLSSWILGGTEESDKGDI